jgi:hypothetical protein
MDSRYSGMNAPSTGDAQFGYNYTYSLIPSLTSSRDGVFDNPIIKPVQKPMKRIGIILPNFTRQDCKDGTMSDNVCNQTINKSILKPQDKCSAHTKMALNLLSSKIFEEDPLT